MGVSLDDSWGCFAGFLGGCLFALAIAERHLNPKGNTMGLSKYEKNCRMIGGIGLILIVLITLIVLIFG